MEFTKKDAPNGTFAKKGTDIKNGDTITIADQGKVIDGKFGEQNVFKIKTTTGEFLMSFNQTSLNSLINEFGTESSSWVGKSVKVIAVNQNVAGKFMQVYYVAPEGYVLGEAGFVKEGVQPDHHVKPAPLAQPTASVEDEVNVEDIPF